MRQFYIPILIIYTRLCVYDITFIISNVPIAIYVTTFCYCCYSLHILLHDNNTHCPVHITFTPLYYMHCTSKILVNTDGEIHIHIYYSF